MSTSTSNDYGNKWVYDTNLKLYHGMLTIPIQMSFYYQNSRMQRVTLNNYSCVISEDGKNVNFYSSENGGSGFKIFYYAIGFVS